MTRAGMTRLKPPIHRLRVFEDGDDGSLRRQRAPAVPQRTGRDMWDVEDGVVSPGAAREVLLGVVDDGIGADGPDEVDVPGAAHAGHLGTERFGDLDGEGADAAGRTVDQDLLSRLHPSPVPESLVMTSAMTSSPPRCSLTRTSTRRPSG